MIELICPSKGRPEKLKRMWESAMQTADKPWQITMSLGVSEEECSEYSEFTHDFEIEIHKVKNWTTAYSWNYLAQNALNGSAKLFMLASDDMIFSTPLWDKALIEHYEKLDNKIHVYALQDSRDKLGTPHPIVTCEYIEAMGYFLPPIFLHWYVDSWTVEIAKRNNVFTHLTDYMLIHDKPSDAGKPDKTHTGIREMGWFERDKFVNDTCQHLLEHEKYRLMEAISHSINAQQHPIAK